MTQTGTRRFCFVALLRRCFFANGLLRAILNHLNIGQGPDTSPLQLVELHVQIHRVGLVRLV